MLKIAQFTPYLYLDCILKLDSQSSYDLLAIRSSDPFNLEKLFRKIRFKNQQKILANPFYQLKKEFSSKFEVIFTKIKFYMVHTLDKIHTRTKIYENLLLLPVFCMAFSLSVSPTAFWSWTHYWIVVRFKYSYINIVLSKYRADSHRITPTYNIYHITYNYVNILHKSNINSKKRIKKWTYNAVEAA